MGNGLRDARERAGLTQAQLAGRVTLTAGAISQFENGERLPSLASALALAAALETTVDALFGAQRVFLGDDSTAAVKPQGNQFPLSATPTAPRRPALASTPGERTSRKPGVGK